MKITVLGSSGCIPSAGKDSPCLLINGRHLVDTGWCGALRLQALGYRAAHVKTVFITHWHPDHCVGLASVLLLIGLSHRRRPDRARLTIAGPAGRIRETVKRAAHFLRYDLFPELRVRVSLLPLKHGQSLTVEELAVETFALPHTTNLARKRKVPSLAYKFREKDGSGAVVTAWDTSFCPDLAGFARHAQILIHDVAHTSARQAAGIARQADVGRLYLVHYGGSGKEVLREARRVFPRSFLAREGHELELAR